MFSDLDPAYEAFYISLVRRACPLLCFLLLLRCALPLLTFRREPEIWGWLVMADGYRIPITHWENVIGRSKNCDVSIALSTVSRNHAVLTRYDDGSWTITDTGSKDGTYVNGERVNICALQDGDTISVGVSRSFFRKEYERACRAETTKDCRQGCNGCGANRLGREGKCDE